MSKSRNIALIYHTGIMYLWTGHVMKYKNAVRMITKWTFWPSLWEYERWTKIGQIIKIKLIKSGLIKKVIITSDPSSFRGQLHDLHTCMASFFHFSSKQLRFLHQYIISDVARLFRHMLACKIFLTNSFVWWNNCQS